MPPNRVCIRNYNVINESVKRDLTRVNSAFSLDCEELQEKLKLMEKKGQHILVVKKLLKQKKSKQTAKEEGSVDTNC